MARRPVRRRRTAVRRARRAGEHAVPLMGAALLAIVLVVLVLTWLAHHLLLLLGLVTAGLAVAGAVVRGRAVGRRRAFEARAAQLRHIGPFLSMSPKEFEQALAVLCRRDGCTDVQVVGGAGDLAADVLATTPAGRRMLIQAKRYGPRTRVGSQEVQQVNGTYRDVHGCDLAAVVTTGSFTGPAAAFCARVGIRALDRTALALWAEGTGAPPWA